MMSPRVDDDAAAGDRVVDLARPAVHRADRRDVAREHGEVAEPLDLGQVADHSVDDEPGDAAVARLRRDEVAEHRRERRAVAVDHDHVAGLGDVEALVDHQVVARVALDRDRRAEEGEVLVGEVADLRHHRVEPVEQVGDGGRLELPEAVNRALGGALDLGADAKARARMHVRSLRLGSCLCRLRCHTPSPAFPIPSSSFVVDMGSSQVRNGLFGPASLLLKTEMAYASCAKSARRMLSAR